MKEGNNIFKFATKELSQDAFICWLIEWINYPEEKELYKSAKNFLDYIINTRNKKYKNQKIELLRYDKVRIRKQEEYIDVLVTINDTYYIIIEDKKFTTEHDEQMEKYRKKLKAKKGCNDENIITVYYKPYEEPDEEIIRNKVDVYIDRKTINTEILKIENNNNIYIDYKKYLRKLEEKVRNIKYIPISEWTGNRELLYKFASDYNKQIKCKESEYELKKCAIANMRGGIYIDVHKLLLKDLDVNNNYKKMFEMIYLSVNLNYEKCELRIRAKAKEYEQKIRDEINALLKSSFTEGKITRQQKGTNINLITIDLDKNMKSDDLNKKIKNTIRTLEKILKGEK